MEERLTVRIGANLSEFERKMSKMQSKMDSVGKSMSSVGSSLTKSITAPVAALAAALGGTAITKGFQRLVGIDTAKAKLEALGHSAGGVEKIMDSALTSVKGTAFGLGEAATTAANAVAAGVEPGEELTRYLSLAGDAAAIAGVDMQEMGGIFNKVQTSNKLQMGEMNQLMDRGIPIVQLLAEELGVAESEVTDLASSGEISAEDFLNAVESGFGGAAAIMGEKSFTAAFANMGAALGRLGASFLDAGGEGGGFFSQMKPMMAEITEIFDKFGDTAADWGVKFGKFTATVIEKVRNLVSWFSNLDSGTQKLIGVIAGLAVAAGPVLLVIGKMITFVSGVATALAPLMASITKAGGLLKWLAPLFGALTSPITLTIAGIAALGAGFVIAYNKSETFRNFVDGIKDKFMTAIEWIGQFKDGVIGLFNGDGTQGMDILTSIGISQEMADKLHEFAGHFIEFYHNVKEQVDKVIGVIGGIADMFKGDWMDGRQMLEKVGLDEEQILAVENGVLKVQRFFHDMKQAIGNALSGIKDFFVEQFEGIRTWWDADGAMIFDAMGTVVSKVFEFITFAVDTALKLVVELFNNFAPIVEGIWGVLWSTIQYVAETVWEKIKLVIGVAMDLIQGIISGVSAIIEGDWERFGEVISETASSIWTRVTEFFTFMKDRSLELFGQLFEGAIQWFSDLWTNVTTKATEIKDSVTGSFTTLKDNAVERVTNMYNSVTGWFGDMKSSATETATNLKDDVVNRFTTMRDDSNQRVIDMFNWVTGKFGELATWVDGKVTGMKDDTVQAFTWMKDGAIEGVQKLYDGASNLFDDVKSYAADTFDNMVDGAKALPGRIGDAIKNMAHKAVEGITSLGKSMGDRMSGVVNGVVGGLNKVLGAIGVSEIPTISISTGGGTATGAAGAIRRFSTGTRNGAIASDMLGMVNDRGPGNGRGGATQELIQRNGQLFAPRGKNAIVPLKKGDRIFNGAETQSLMSSGVIPRFSQGTGAEGGNSGEKKGLLGTLKDVVSNVWDYISNPGKAFESLMSSVTANFDGFDGFAGKLLSGGFKMVTDGIKNFIAKIFKENEGALGSGKAGNWMGYRMTTPYSPNRPVPGYPTGFNGGRHYGIDYGTPIGTPITATTGGQLSSFWNEGGGKIAKLVTGQLRQFFMHMQTVAPNGSVKAGDVIGKSGNSGRWTTGPHVHWQAQQGTDALNRNTIDPRKVIGHANGGIFSHQHVANFAEEGPEAIIPLSAKRRGRANSLYNSVGKAIGADDGSKEMIRNQQIQIDRLDTAINVLLGIEDKTGFEPGKAKKSIDRHIDDRAIIY